VKLAFVVAAAGTALGLGANAAFADTVLNIQYPITGGSTYLTGPGSTVALGAGTTTVSADLTTDTLSGITLSLPPATASFSVLGIPSTATTVFNQVGTGTGTINKDTGAVSITVRVNIQITGLWEAGIPIAVGSACQTVVPATITVNSGSDWSVLNGGTLTGTYSIPLFNNCGLLDVLAPVIDLIVPSSGNTISLDLGAASTA
jgi:hypothetical protein